MTSGDRPIVLFDGRCGFCTWSVQFARQRVGADVDFVSYQSVDVAEYGLTVGDCAEAVQYVDSQGTRSGERAVAAILQSGYAIWRPVGRVIESPPVRPVAGVVYRLVARHRGRLWGVQPPIS